LAKIFGVIIDQYGNTRFLEPIHLPSSRRSLVTILEDPIGTVSETAQLSEKALAEEWLKQENDIELYSIHFLFLKEEASKLPAPSYLYMYRLLLVASRPQGALASLCVGMTLAAALLIAVSAALTNSAPSSL
jgi:hypothetical protein